MMHVTAEHHHDRITYRDVLDVKVVQDTNDTKWAASLVGQIHQSQVAHPVSNWQTTWISVHHEIPSCTICARVASD
jgi:hypothetical protein